MWPYINYIQHISHWERYKRGFESKPCRILTTHSSMDLKLNFSQQYFCKILSYITVYYLSNGLFNYRHITTQIYRRLIELLHGNNLWSSSLIRPNRSASSITYFPNYTNTLNQSLNFVLGMSAKSFGSSEFAIKSLVIKKIL